MKITDLVYLTVTALEITAKDDKGQEITLPLLDMAEFSGYHKIEDTKFAVHYSVQWIGWSAFDQIDFGT
ncbi:outer membrane protein transport protein [Vibrio lentus]|nr:outer membrane protein transport protein [Vibrio lentus]